jgi:hypothetical protein
VLVLGLVDWLVVLAALVVQLPELPGWLVGWLVVCPRRRPTSLGWFGWLVGFVVGLGGVLSWFVWVVSVLVGLCSLAVFGAGWLLHSVSGHQ